MTSWFNIPTQIDAILKLLQAMQAEENKMADVLDSEIQAQAAMTTSLAALVTDVQTLMADFAAYPPPAGSILSSDPRWATLTTAISQAATTITTLDTSVKAALPAPPTP